MRQTCSTFFANFRDDESASLTVEFIIIIPVLFTWFLGSIVFFDAFNTKATAQRTAHTLADIISRQTSVDNDFVDSLLTIQNRMLPRESVGMVRITSIQRDESGDLQLLWTYNTNTGATPLEMEDIPLNTIPLMANGESILLLDTRVPFVPIADWVGFTATTWINRVAVAPRFVEPLPNTDF